MNIDYRMHARGTRRLKHEAVVGTPPHLANRIGPHEVNSLRSRLEQRQACADPLGRIGKNDRDGLTVRLGNQTDHVGRMAKRVASDVAHRRQ